MSFARVDPPGARYSRSASGASSSSSGSAAGAPDPSGDSFAGSAGGPASSPGVSSAASFGASAGPSAPSEGAAGSALGSSPGALVSSSAAQAATPIASISAAVMARVRGAPIARMRFSSALATTGARASRLGSCPDLGDNAFSIFGRRCAMARGTPLEPRLTGGEPGRESRAGPDSPSRATGRSAMRPHHSGTP